MFFVHYYEQEKLLKRINTIHMVIETSFQMEAKIEPETSLIEAKVV